MKKVKIGLVPKLIIAIILGILIGRYAPLWLCRAVVTASGLFGTFLKFVIPLLILAFVTMGIADLSQGAGKLLLITLATGSTGSVQAASVGGGNIRVDLINNMHVDFNGESNTLLVMHQDRPGVIAAVTNLMREEYAELNICNFHLSRERRGGDAIMTIESDNLPPAQLIQDIRKLEHVTNALLIRRL